MDTQLRTIMEGHWFRLGMTRSSAIAERPARRCIPVEMLTYCCRNNANRSRVSPWAIVQRCLRDPRFSRTTLDL